MSEQLWKVHIPFKRGSDVVDHGIMTFSGLASLYGELIEWLKENDRLHHLVMAYDNDKEGVRVTLNDPDTAILLKLALG